MMVVLTERSSSLSRDFCLVPISSPFPCPCFYLSLFHPSAVSWFSNFFTPPGSSLAHTSRCCKRMNEQSGCRFSLWSLWPIAPQLLCNRYPSDHTMTRFLCSCLRAPKHPKYSFFPPLAPPLFALLTCFFASRDVTDHADVFIHTFSKRWCHSQHWQATCSRRGRRRGRVWGMGKEGCVEIIRWRWGGTVLRERLRDLRLDTWWQRER